MDTSRTQIFQKMLALYLVILSDIKDRSSKTELPFPMRHWLYSCTTNSKEDNVYCLSGICTLAGWCICIYWFGL